MVSAVAMLRLRRPWLLQMMWRRPWSAWESCRRVREEQRGGEEEDGRRRSSRMISGLGWRECKRFAKIEHKYSPFPFGESSLLFALPAAEAAYYPPCTCPYSLSINCLPVLIQMVATKRAARSAAAARRRPVPSPRLCGRAHGPGPTRPCVRQRSACSRHRRTTPFASATQTGAWPRALPT